MHNASPLNYSEFLPQMVFNFRCAASLQPILTFAPTKYMRQGAAGFSAVMEAMRDSHRPAVGHNCLFDIMFVMAGFVDPRLPRHW